MSFQRLLKGLFPFLAILFPFLVISCFARGQTIPVTTGSKYVDQISPRAQVKLSFGIPVVHDTGVAMIGTLDSLGLIIQIRSTGVIYRRDTVLTGGHFWNPLPTSSSGGVTAAAGDVAGTASGATLNLTIQPNVVNNSDLALAPAKTLKGNVSTTASTVGDLTASQVNGLLGLGSAAFFNTPSVGDASPVQVVIGTDSRLTDQRDAKSIQGTPVSATPPTNGQTLIYNSGSNSYIPGTITGGTGGSSFSIHPLFSSNFSTSTNCPLPALNHDSLQLFSNDLGRFLTEGTEWQNLSGGGFSILISGFNASVNSYSFTLYANNVAAPPGPLNFLSSNFSTSTSCPIPAFNGMTLSIYWNDAQRYLTSAEWSVLAGGGFTVLVSGFNASVNNYSFYVFAN